MAATSTMGTWWDSSTNKDTFKTLVDKWFNSTDRPALVEWQNMMRDLSSEDEYERRGRFAGLDYGSEVDLGFRITDRMKRFEKLGLYEFLIKDLRNKAEETKDVEIAKLWNNLTVTTYNANSFDGLAIAHDSHTCLDDSATTYDNYLDAALSTSSLESARNYFDYMYDDQGNIFTADPDTLAVNYSLVVTAEELLGSSLKPHEFSNTINYFKSADLKIFDYHRFTSTTAWVMLAKGNDKYDGFVYTAQSPDVKVYDAPDQTRDVIVDSQQYFIYGMGDPRMVYVGDT
jgi:hypothetical protein